MLKKEEGKGKEGREGGKAEGKEGGREQGRQKGRLLKKISEKRNRLKERD